MTKLSDPLDALGVSRETIARLEDFQKLLEKWNPAINLVSRRSLNDGWNRHIVDSAEVYGECADNARSWVDLGSGGGLPGIVVAIIARELDPSRSFTLIESDRRKAAFLSTAAKNLDLRVTVLTDRIEKIPPLGADILSARALAPLKTLCSYAVQHLGENGTALFQKGINFADEILDAQKHWQFRCNVIASRTQSGSVILQLNEIRHV